MKEILMQFNPDIINGLFEFSGSIAIFISAFKCFKNKSADGVSWVMTAFFFTWGVWNLYFYSHLSQSFSFWAGVMMLLSNVIYTSLIVRYSFFNPNNKFKETMLRR